MTSIPVAPLANALLPVYFRTLTAAPTANDLRVMVTRAFDAIGEPLGSLARDVLGRPGLVRIEVRRANELPAPPMPLLQYTGATEAELDRMRRATHAAVVTTTLPRFPGFPHA